MTNSKPFNVVIAGFGWWGQHMVRRLTEHPDFHVLGVIEPAAALHDKIRAAGVEAISDFDAVLTRDDVEALILTTPNTLHEEQVCKAAAAGKHVFCEKPLGLNGASAKRSVEACLKAGVQLGIGHERRFETAMQDLRRMIEAGELGTIMHTEAAWVHDRLINVPAGDWRTSKAVAPAAGMTGMGIHLTDLMISFFGRVNTVQAMVGHRVLDWETGDVVTAQLGFASGPTATLSAILYTPQFIRMHVYGNKAWVQILNESQPDMPGGRVTMTISESGKDHVVREITWNDAVVANLEAFMRAARGGAPYPFTPEQMVHNIEVLEAIAASAENRETVRIPAA